MKETRVIVITGPRLSGKSSFLSSLESAIRSNGFSCSRLIRATTRPKREGELFGEEYHFYTLSDMEERIMDGEVIPLYEHRGYKYGIIKKYLESNGDFKLMALANPTMVFGLETLIGFDVTPVLLYTDPQKLYLRFCNELLKTKKEGWEDTISRNKDFEEQFSTCMEHLGDYRYIIFNPDMEFGTTKIEILNHLANRVVQAIKFEEEPTHQKLNNDQLRERYIDTLVQKLLGISPDEAIRNPQKCNLLALNKTVEQYSCKFGGSISDLQNRIPRVLSVARSHGIFSIYVDHLDKNEKILYDIFKELLGVQQYGYDTTGTIYYETSSMSLTNFSGLYSAFYISFSLAYDPPIIPALNAPLHTLTVEGIYNPKALKLKQVLPLETSEAKKLWESRERIITQTKL